MKFFFSMIELLVVFALMLIILSLLSPSIQRMMTQAHKTRCQAHQKNIGQGYGLFSEDHNYKIPIYSRSNPFDNLYWCFEISPYLNLDITNHLSFKAASTTLECPSHDYSYSGVSVDSRYGGYGPNYRYTGYQLSHSGGSGRQKFTSMNFPSQTILLGDSLDYKDLYYTDTTHQIALTAVYRPEYNPWHGQMNKSIRHDGGFNKLWGDLHVGFDFWEEIEQGKNDNPFYYFELVKAFGL